MDGKWSEIAEWIMKVKKLWQTGEGTSNRVLANSYKSLNVRMILLYQVSFRDKSCKVPNMNSSASLTGNISEASSIGMTFWDHQKAVLFLC